MNSTDVVNITLPAIHYRGLVPLPHNEIRLETLKAETHLLIKDVMESPDKLVVLLIKSQFLSISNQPTDFNNIAVIGKITSVTEVGTIQKITINFFPWFKFSINICIIPFVIKIHINSHPSSTN